MFLFNNPIICVILIGVLMNIPTFITLIKMEKMTQLHEQYGLETNLLIRRIESLQHKVDELAQQESENNNNLNSLSSGVRYFIQEHKEMENSTIMPTPQLSEMIGVTIQEQIATEEMLCHNMKIPRPDGQYKIIENVCKTYPHVDKEYIAKRVTATIESNIMKAARGES
jgi:hypothetical protein